MNIKHKVRILWVGESKYIVYIRKYVFGIFPYWKQLLGFENVSFDDVYKFANEIAYQQVPHILEIDYDIKKLIANKHASSI